MGWLPLVGSLVLQVSFAEYHLFYRFSFEKETYNFKEPTSRSHPIVDVDFAMSDVAIGSLVLQVSFAEYRLFYRFSFEKETYNLDFATSDVAMLFRFRASGLGVLV